MQGGHDRPAPNPVCDRARPCCNRWTDLTGTVGMSGFTRQSTPGVHGAFHAWRVGVDSPVSDSDDSRRLEDVRPSKNRANCFLSRKWKRLGTPSYIRSITACTLGSVSWSVTCATAR